MRFGPVPLNLAEGAILAHSVVLPEGSSLRKGQRLHAADLDRLRAAGIAEVMAARLDPGDVDETEAAVRLAEALVPDEAAAHLRRAPPVNGRVNLHATEPGVLVVDVAAIGALNRIDPAITLATLPSFARVAPRTLVGTAKIISYAVPGTALEAACAAGRGALRVAPVVRRSAGLVLSEVPGQKSSLAEKGRRAVAGRLRALGITLEAVVSVPHRMHDIAGALAALPGDIALILTGSATSDLHDVAPEAVRAAGGSVARFGMPVDPGNLLFHGRQGGRPVIGLPGCARSPALNGADWVLDRIACGFDPSDEDIAAMGVGGLLKETPLRPHPRESGAADDLDA
ncbi:MAG: molybdopterin-binding protein [Gemmobacter sp.]